MLERGSGRIINMVSGSARYDPIAPAGAGGWGIGYSASKAAFGRVAGGIEAEFSAQGVRAFNVDPGNVLTEKRKALRPVDDFEGNYGAEPPEATAAVVAWLASSPDATSMVGKWIYAPKLCADRGLLPGWPPAKAERLMAGRRRSRTSWRCASWPRPTPAAPTASTARASPRCSCPRAMLRIVRRGVEDPPVERVGREEIATAIARSTATSRRSTSSATTT